MRLNPIVSNSFYSDEPCCAPVRAHGLEPVQPTLGRRHLVPPRLAAAFSPRPGQVWSSRRDKRRRTVARPNQRDPLVSAKWRSLAIRGNGCRQDRTQEVAGSSPASSTNETAEGSIKGPVPTARSTKRGRPQSVRPARAAAH